MVAIRRAACAAVVALIVTGWAGAVASADQTFTITGDADGLYPGAAETISVHIDNPFDDALHVASIEAISIEEASPECPATLLEVVPFHGDVAVPPHGTSSVEMAAELVRAAPDSCTNADFTLHFTGTGTVDTEIATGVPPSTSDPLLASLARTGAMAAPLAGIGAGAVLLGLAVRRRARGYAA